MPVDTFSSVDPPSSLLFQRLRAVGRLAALWELAGEYPREPLGPELWRLLTTPEAPDELASRYEAALRDTGDDALPGARALAGDVGRDRPGSSLHIDALVLVVRRALEDGAIDKALAAALAAEALAPGEGDDPPALWARFEAALADMIASSDEPVDDLEVVLRQAQQRELSRTVQAAAQALAAASSE